MKENIIIRSANGSISDEVKSYLLNTIQNRVENLCNKEFLVTVVTNPNLEEYRSAQLISGNSARYLVDDFGIVDDETKIRLATLRLKPVDMPILFAFEIKKEPISMESSLSEKVMPSYLLEELNFTKDVIESQNSWNHKQYNSFCICGNAGEGKTSFVKILADQLGVQLWLLSFNDIDAENTALITQKIDSFFKHIKNNDIVLIENTDSFLCGTDVNRFVKNILLSYIGKRNDIYFFFESLDPSSFDSDLKKNIFRYVYVKPNVESSRNKYLLYFLSEYGVHLDESSIVDISTAGLSIKDLKNVAFLTGVLGSKESNLLMSLQKSIDSVRESLLHSAISSDSPFVAKKPKYKLDDLVLPESKKNTIKYAVSLVSQIPVVYGQWNFSTIDPYPRAVLNFYGKPGTGKTMGAHAVADYLGKDLLALNYAEIESKYIGDAPKKLESAFSYARQHDCVMFFDEADSFLGKRIEDVSHSADQALNSLRSTMLIQLEMFEGVVIFATNLRENYDKAFKTRFLYEIEFELPDFECRRTILSEYSNKIIPLRNANFSDEQLVLLSNDSAGLSGRDIKSVVLEALNEFAYNGFDSSCLDASLPFELLHRAILDRVNNLSPEMTAVTSGVDEDKKMIAEELSRKLVSEDTSTKDALSNLVTMAYLAAWSDGVLHEKELAIIKDAEKELNVKLPMDYTIQGNLPSLSDVLYKTKEIHKGKEVIELCCRIVAADGSYRNEEIVFVHSVCSELGLTDDQIMAVDEVINLMARESVILGDLELC